MPEELLLNGDKAPKFEWMVTAVYPNFVECIRCDNCSPNSYCRGDLVVCGYEEGQPYVY